MKRRATASGVMLLLAFLPACYQPEHSFRRQGAHGYQFDEPREYCRLLETDSGFEMYCPEGKITIEFIPSSLNQSAEDVLTDLLDEMSDPSKYTLSELEGKHSKISLAEASDSSPVQGNYPTYIATFLFDVDYIVIAKGLLYNSEFENQFKPAFRTLIMTLEPWRDG